MVPSVTEARARGVLNAAYSPELPNRVSSGPDGREDLFDAIIWCTGFQASPSATWRAGAS